MSITLVGLGWAALGIMCYFQFVRRLTTLDYSYMAFALYPHAFACLGAVPLRDARRGASRPRRLSAAVILGTLLLLLPTPLPGLMETRRAGSARASGAIVAPLVVSLVGVAPCFCCAARSRDRVRGLVLGRERVDRAGARRRTGWEHRDIGSRC